MSQHLEMELEVIEGTNGNSKPLRASAALQTHSTLGYVTLDARAVEFIARPGKERELRECIRGKVIDSLRKRDGFAGACVLTSHKEPRLILVLSFWKTEQDATDIRWEETPGVRRLISPLADVCRKVHTYEAALPDRAEALRESTGTTIC